MAAVAAVVALALTVATFLVPLSAEAATHPDLGAAGSFAVVAGGKVTNQGPTDIVGDVGVGPGHDTGGVVPQRVNGSVHLGDDAWARAHGDLSRAFDALASPLCDSELGDDDLAGKVLGPGTICASSRAKLSQTLTLDGRGDPDAVFVVRIPGSLTTEAGSAIVLVNGAQACNVVFRVGDSAGLGRDSTFKGTILAERSVTLAPRTALEGRALSRGGNVELDTNNVAVPVCAARAMAPPPGPAPLGAVPANPPGSGAREPLPAPPLTGPSSPLGTVPSSSTGSSPPLGGGPPPVALSGGGDDTETPPAGGFPADLAARRDSVQRTGPSNTQALIDALAPLGAYGLTPEQIAQIGFGRFPVGGYATYTHDWWFPRFGPAWRLHEGTDIFAAAGTPVRSPTEGTVRLVTGGLGGITVYVVEPNGTYYYLAHLAGRAPGLVEGASVTTGQVVGFVGTSGNAQGTPPHLHFEVHPNGGGPIDPKPVLDQFLADAKAGSANLLSAYAAAPSTVVDGTAASAQPPVPTGSGSASPAPVPTSSTTPGGGKATDTLLWAVIAGLAGLLVNRTRGGEADVVARADAPPANRERVRPTLRRLYQKWVARPTPPVAPKGTTSDPGHVSSPEVPERSAEAARHQLVSITSHGVTGAEPQDRTAADPRSAEPADPRARASETTLALWATCGFGRPVPTATPAVVDKVIALKPLPPREARAIRALTQAEDPIQPLLLPTDLDRMYITSAAVAALVSSGIPTLVCCATRAGAEHLERAGAFEVLTGLPVLTTDQLFDEMESGSGQGFVDDTVVVVAEALQVPVADLARLAGHLSRSGGCMKLLLHRPEGGWGRHAGPELAPANGSRQALPSSTT
jgi:hypothetical protein